MADIEFKEELPIWEAEGVKPPLSKIQEGWNVGDRPPADWWNWFQYRTFKSIEELREVAKQLGLDLENIDVSEELIALKEEVEEMIENIPDVFHDLPQNSVKESMSPIDFEHGISICSQSAVNSFPTINDYGMTITVRGAHSSYGQIFITRYGDIWSRRSAVLSEWNGDWYNAKKEIDEVKQSGVESNKILVDALNSKKIPASTSDTIKTNVNKVNNIKIPTGTVKPGEVLEGKTYSSDEGTDLVGTMPNRGNLNKTIKESDFEGKQPGVHTILKVNEGYYSGGSISIEVPIDDTSGSPGSKKIQIGDKEEGYYGVVPASQLITGNELTREVGVTQGTSQHSDTSWHKFSFKGKTLFIAQKTIRRIISWDHLNSKNVVYGNKTIEIDGIKYKVRLIRGTLTDPSKYNDSDQGTKGSEWNRLVAPLSIERKDNSWYYKERMEDNLKDWKTYLSHAELDVDDSNGSYTWCQEVSGGDSGERVTRGGRRGTSTMSTWTSSYEPWNGWRPVLEVIE